VRGGGSSGAGKEYKAYDVVARAVIVVLFLLFLLQLPVWGYLVQNLLQGDNLAETRRSLFVGNEISLINKILYGYSYAVFYNVLIVTSFAFIYCFEKKSFLLFSIFFIVISGFLKGSRAEVYQFLLVGLLYLFSVNLKFIYQVRKKYWSYTFCTLFLCFLLVYWVSITRADSFFYEVVKYHSVGFVLLTKYVGGQIGMLVDDFNLGVAFFGGIDFLIGLMARFLFWVDYQSSARTLLDLQNVSLPTQTFISVVGPGEESYALTGHNAFYTLISSAYQAFGVYGCMLLGLLLGFFIRHLVIGSRDRDLVSSFYLIMSISVVSMGIFSSSLDAVGFWLTMITLNVILGLSAVSSRGFAILGRTVQKNKHL